MRSYQDSPEASPNTTRPQTPSAPASRLHPTIGIEGLHNLIAVLRDYDSHRATLETEGGNVALLKETTNLLKKTFSISGHYGNATVTLSDPDLLRRVLCTIGQDDVYLAVRSLHHGLPSYYLARTRRDHWNLYNFVVQDLYLSPGHPFLDKRFTRFMICGHERYFLRMSMFRAQADRIVGLDPVAGATRSDALLYALGRCVFQGAWHTDQRFSFVLADAFGIPSLKHAVELTYLAIGCDLSALRRFLDEPMHRFFKECYDNRAVAELLERLETMTGADMVLIAQKGIETYRNLVGLVNGILTTQVRWNGECATAVPLWKLGVANLNRLPLVAAQLKEEEDFQVLREKLAAGAEQCIATLLAGE